MYKYAFWRNNIAEWFLGRKRVAPIYINIVGREWRCKSEENNLFVKKLVIYFAVRKKVLNFIFHKGT